MSISTALLTRSESKCELCGSAGDLKEYTVPPKASDDLENQVAVCDKCHTEFSDPDHLDTNHWRCLNDSMWSTIPAVQVMAYRTLKQLSTNQDWAQDLLNMMYLDDDTREWAEAAADGPVIHKDANGNILQAGDTVTLIQDLNVKGAGFTAKRGVAVRRIRLVHDNAEHIEGKVDGQQIVILTKYVKKS